jgi:SNF2 family DNA or RNA helicase
VKYKPHNYQQYTTNFLKTHPTAAVLLEMGLGKTVIALTALADLLFDSFEAHKILIIAPLRVARDTWPDELKKWEHLSHLKFAVAVGTAEERLAALNERADIYLINRENVAWLIQQSGVPFHFDTVVIDELSSFKSHKSVRFQALMMVRPKIRRIIGLTGTPSSNGLMDLWAQFRLLDMGERLGKFLKHYRYLYFEPDQRNGQVVYSYKLKPTAEKRIYKRISDITISMKADDHLVMPELIAAEVDVHLSEVEAKRYKKLKRDLVLDGPDGEVTASNAAALAGKLSQMANGAVYTDDKNWVKVHDRKLEALEDLIEAANGKPLLVAYWFKHDLARIMERLTKLGVEHQELKSAASLKRWNAGQIPVALIHPASAGHGLNLQAGGSTLVWFGLTWSLELYQQTNARLWRQGQSAETVVIHHIITKGTIDERIMTALSAKEKSQTALIDAVKAQI